MRVLFYRIGLALNVVALIIALIWIYKEQSFDAITTSLALSSTLLILIFSGLRSKRRHPSEGNNVVNQKDNIVSGDLAGRDINKK